MAKQILRERILCVASFGAFLLFIALWFYTDDRTYSPPRPVTARIRRLPPHRPTFYDDPTTRYTMDKPMFNWDEKRSHWLKTHPDLPPRGGVMVISGSQPGPCRNPSGDHFLLRFFKNKVDYSRIHGYEVFYNNAFLDPKMRSVWAKVPILRAAMLARPETEWFFWVDSDAIFTDMDFRIPLERYSGHNLVVHGYPKMIYEEKSWVSVNTGAVLIRNCQWSMDFLDVWAAMGPRSPDFDKWGQILRSTLSDKVFPAADEQSALVYVLLKGNKKWTSKIYVENEYFLHGYWLGLVDKLDGIERNYLVFERKTKRLRRRHAEGEAAEDAAVTAGWGDDKRRPFITHFTGCQPCSGDHNPDYVGDSCTVGMERALNFADNQVLRNYGFFRPDLVNATYVKDRPFDFPGEGI